MSTNSLGRLNDALFEELERLSSLDIENEDACKLELARSKSIQGVAKEINASAKTIMDVTRLRAEFAGTAVVKPPKLLEG